MLNEKRTIILLLGDITKKLNIRNSNYKKKILTFLTGNQYKN